MEIIEEKSDICEFHNVEVGTAFKYGEMYYLKIFDSFRLQNFNAFCFNRKEPCYFDFSDKVEKVKAKLTIYN